MQGSNRHSRRAFLQVFGLAAAGTLVAACQSSTPATSPTAATSATAAPGAKPAGASQPAAAAATPRRGGTLTWAVWDKIDDVGSPGTELEFAL